MKIKTEEFNDKYSLDNFLVSYNDFYKDHLEWKSDIIPLFIDEEKKEPFFICSVCDKLFLEYI